MTTLFVVNKSTRVTDADVATMTQACHHQARYHFCPLYGVRDVPVIYTNDESTAPAGSYVIGVFDDSDQAGALGWHTEGPQGQIYGKVFAGPVLDNGGDALTKDLSVASVLSHEVLETIGDPHANLWADAGNGTAYAYEVCDPVESDSYVVPVGSTKVTVSNFVTQSWFDPQAPKGDRFDWLHNLSSPFQMSKGGYVVLMKEGRTSQQFGETFPEWRKSIKERPSTAKRPKGE